MNDCFAMPPEAGPRVLVLSTLFPSKARPQAGLFIRERMRRVAERLPVVVVSPQPWFPLQALIRIWRPHFRPDTDGHEQQQNLQVHYPRFFSFPGVAKGLDGMWMALSCVSPLRRLKREFGFEVIDAHFAYPDGYAAVKLGQWFRVPVTITLRGTEIPLSRDPARRKRMIEALKRAEQIFSVSQSLKDHAISLGVDGQKIIVVGNGVDTEVFHPIDRDEARQRLNIPGDAKVLISVGALVPRKGQHRVIEVLPRLVERFPNLLYLVVGGASPEGDFSQQLMIQVSQLGLENHVRFLGAMPPAELKLPLSAADVFVLATSNEGWANVFLEAMACGLPVVTTDVGGNREVVARDELGSVVPFGDSQALGSALQRALEQPWNREAILAYARDNEWDRRIEKLVSRFQKLKGRT